MGNYDSNRYTYRGHKQTKLGGPCLVKLTLLISAWWGFSRKPLNSEIKIIWESKNYHLGSTFITLGKSFWRCKVVNCPLKAETLDCDIQVWSSPWVTNKLVLKHSDVGRTPSKTSIERMNKWQWEKSTADQRWSWTTTSLDQVGCSAGCRRSAQKAWSEAWWEAINFGAIYFPKTKKSHWTNHFPLHSFAQRLVLQRAARRRLLVHRALSRGAKLRHSGCGEHQLNTFPAGSFILRYPLVIQHSSYWKWPFIVSFPIKNGDFP